MKALSQLFVHIQGFMQTFRLKINPFQRMVLIVTSTLIFIFTTRCLDLRCNQINQLIASFNAELQVLTQNHYPFGIQYGLLVISKTGYSPECSPYSHAYLMEIDFHCLLLTLGSSESLPSFLNAGFGGLHGHKQGGHQTKQS